MTAMYSLDSLTDDQLDELVNQVRFGRVRRRGPLYFQEVLPEDLCRRVFESCEFHVKHVLRNVCRGKSLLLFAT